MYIHVLTSLQANMANFLGFCLSSRKARRVKSSSSIVSHGLAIARPQRVVVLSSRHIVSRPDSHIVAVVSHIIYSCRKV